MDVHGFELHPQLKSILVSRLLDDSSHVFHNKEVVLVNYMTARDIKLQNAPSFCNSEPRLRLNDVRSAANRKFRAIPVPFRTQPKKNLVIVCHTLSGSVHYDCV